MSESPFKISKGAERISPIASNIPPSSCALEGGTKNNDAQKSEQIIFLIIVILISFKINLGWSSFLS